MSDVVVCLAGNVGWRIEKWLINFREEQERNLRKKFIAKSIAGIFNGYTFKFQQQVNFQQLQGRPIAFVLNPSLAVGRIHKMAY
jgi:hypothetical protein